MLNGDYTDLNRNISASEQTKNTIKLTQIPNIIGVPFITPVTDPATTALPAGKFFFTVYADSTVPATLYTYFYKISVAGAQTLIADTNIPIVVNGSPKEYNYMINVPQVPLEPTDRIGIDFLAASQISTTNTSIFTLYFNGSTVCTMYTTFTNGLQGPTGPTGPTMTQLTVLPQNSGILRLAPSQNGMNFVVRSSSLTFIPANLNSGWFCAIKNGTSSPVTLNLNTPVILDRQIVWLVWDGQQLVGY